MAFVSCSTFYLFCALYTPQESHTVFSIHCHFEKPILLEIAHLIVNYLLYMKKCNAVSFIDIQFGQIPKPTVEMNFLSCLEKTIYNIIPNY